MRNYGHLNNIDSFKNGTNYLGKIAVYSLLFAIEIIRKADKTIKTIASNFLFSISLKVYLKLNTHFCKTCSV